MKLAFVFPGQGSQANGMLADLAQAHPTIASTFAEASEVLGFDLWALVQSDDNQQLSQTAITQPALLASSVAIWRAWREAGHAMPALLAGHSLGEYSALVCADALDFRDAIDLVRKRGEFMQSAVPAGSGAMAAILGLDDDVVVAACDDVDTGVVAAVNFNAPGQVVIAGDKSAVDAAIERCKAAGARRALPLPVSVPSHCALMEPAAEKLAETLAAVAIKRPSIPVINNVDVQIEQSPEAIQQALVRQLHSPVRWVESMREMGRQDVDTIFECGPGKVLCGLHKRIDRKVKTAPLETAENFVAAAALITDA
ncbi:MAG: ACP S-malonyltransferase [Woeseiaceae bacterium]